MREPQFYTYAFTEIAFSGLFTYVAASPILFMDVFKVDAKPMVGFLPLCL
jgi:DHA1 family bicyclomycin/chloramphenicol resistance-like MFS transporter